MQTTLRPAHAMLHLGHWVGGCAGVVLALPSSGAEFRYAQPFDLGPGETAAALAFPRFNPSEHPATPVLTDVDIRIEGTFRADVFRPGSPEAPADGRWSLGPASVVVGAGTPDLAVPAVLTLALVGAQGGPPSEGAGVLPALAPSAESHVTVTGAAARAYRGAGEVSYDVDFSAGYVLVRTDRAVEGSLYANDRVSGTLVVTYRAEASLGRPLRLSASLSERPASLRLGLAGEAGEAVAVESTPDVGTGRWSAVDIVRLSVTGAGEILLPLEPDRPRQFYRARRVP